MTGTDWVKELERLMAALRAEDGCPWDREQDHHSLKKYLIEEAYEFIDAIDEGDDAKMASELGDVLLQVVFHSQIAREEERFDLQEVARRCCEMLVRRHPHVFGDKHCGDAEAVMDQWEAIKKTEAAGKERSSVLDGVPKYLPSLAYAEKLQKKASKVGFDWRQLSGPMEKIDEEVAEVKEALASGDQEHAREEMGDLLFAVVNSIRFIGGDAETLMRQACHKFSDRFRRMEAQVKESGKRLNDYGLEELEALWQQAKLTSP